MSPGSVKPNNGPHHLNPVTEKEKEHHIPFDPNISQIPGISSDEIR
jgi:hypothetical protein